MTITGATIRFTCANGEQIEAIGRFWDDIRALCPTKELKGVGYGWQNDTLSYLIGATGDGTALDKARILAQRKDAQWLSLDLPDEGWLNYRCAASDIGATYELIYRDGPLTYEIEQPVCDQWTLMVYRDAAKAK